MGPLRNARQAVQKWVLLYLIYVGLYVSHQLQTIILRQHYTLIYRYMVPLTVGAPMVKGTLTVKSLHVELAWSGSTRMALSKLFVPQNL